MKPGKTFQKYIFFVTIIFCFEYAKCVLDCSSTKCIYQNGACISPDNTDTCDPGCRPLYTDNSPNFFSCHDCSGVTSEYYSINSGTCSSICSGSNIIADTKECTSAGVSNLYSLGDFYYTTDPSSNDNTIKCFADKSCQCSKYFYKDNSISSKLKYKCYNTIEAAAADGYYYYQYDTNEFFQNGCPNGFIRQKASTSSGVTRCSNECYGNEWYTVVTSGTEEYCVDDCGGGTYKYKHIDNGIKKCLDDCPGGTYKKGTDCVTLDQCELYDGNTCYSTCPGGKPYHNYGSKECISGCTGTEYIYKKDPDDYICYRKEDCNFIDETDSSNKKCLDLCPSTKYNDYNSKLCFSNCGQGDTEKVYHAENKYVCYSSCSEIPGGEYIYEGISDNTCYKTKPSSGCDVYYKKESGIKKCATMSICVTTVNYNYLIGDECRDNCLGYYQTVTTATVGATIIPYIDCSVSLSAALAKSIVKFCDKSQKICWSTFPNDEEYFFLSELTISPNIKYEITRECPKFYYEITCPSGVIGVSHCYKCIDDCKNFLVSGNAINKYFVSGNKKCEDSCSKFHKYYFDDSNNECLDSCESRPTKPYSYPVIDPLGGTNLVPEKCKASCDNEDSRGYFHNYNSHICLSSCGEDGSTNFYFKKTSTSDNTYQYICFSSCKDIPGEYIYELNDKLCTNTEITTLPSTLDGNTYDYYYKKSDGVIKYVSANDCQTMNYKHLLGFECKKDCGDNYYKLEVTIDTNTFTKCFSEPNECLGGRVSDSNKIYYNQKVKKCWEGINSIYSNYYIQKMETDLYELVDECENYYYEYTVAGGDGFKHCVSSCSSSENPISSNHKYFIKGNKKCLSSSDCITTFNKYYYDDSTNECLDSCEEVSKYQKVLQTSPPTALIACLPSCPTTSPDNFPFNNYDSNICLAKCGDDGSNNIYHADDQYICYPSCSDIPGQKYIYELKGDDNIYTCYDDESTAVTAGCDYYYVQSDGIRKCTVATDCKSKNKIYVVGHECRDSCGDDYYKLDIGDDSTIQKPFFKCFQTFTDCFNFYNDITPAPFPPIPIYYHQQLKRCWKDFPTDYYIKDKTNPIDGNKYELVEECDDFYYIDTSPAENICLSSCSDNPINADIYFIKGNKKCLSLSECFTTFNKYYYDDSTNECLDSCEEVSKFQKQFSSISPTPTTPIACLPSCPTAAPDNIPYNNYDSNICLAHCGADGSNNIYHADGQYICYPSCSDIPTQNYIYEIKDTSITTSITIYTCETTLPENCDYYYIRSDGIRQCTDAAGCKNKNYNYIFGNECRDSCGNDYYKTDITINTPTPPKPFIKCFQTLTECSDYYNDVTPAPASPYPIYYHEKLKRCWKDFPSNYYIKDKTNPIDGNKYELVEECDDFYYIGTSPTENICISSCSDNPISSTNKYFIKGNKKCLSLANCATLTKYYYDQDNNECLDSCEGRTRYKYQKKFTSLPSESIACLDECPSSTNVADNFPFHDSDSNICLSSCGTGDPNKKVNADGQTVCYTSCAEIPGGEYTYEIDGVCHKTTTSCNYYYIKTNGAKKCSTDQQTCIEKNYKYFIADASITNFECKDSCDGYYKREDTFGTAPGTKITYCYDSFSKVESDTNVKYYNIKSKLCWTKYPSGYFVIPNTGATKEVVEECEFFYYKNSETEDSTTIETIDIFYCVNSCSSATTADKFFAKGQKNCEASCDKFNKYFFDGYECLDTCKGRTGKEFAQFESNSNGHDIYKCVNECPHSTSTDPSFHDYESNICMTECGLAHVILLHQKMVQVILFVHFII